MTPQYGCSSRRILDQYGDVLLELCPEFAPHCPTSPQKGKPALQHKVKPPKHLSTVARPPTSNGPRDNDGISLAHRPLFDLMAKDLKARDWSKPFTSVQWVNDISRKVSTRIFDLYHS